MSRASGCGSSASALQALGVAHEAGVAPQRRARLGGWAARAAGARRRLAGRAARLGERRERGARAEDEALAQRVGGQAVGAVQAGARASRRRRRGPGTVVAPSRSATIAAHAVVRGGRDRHELGAPGRGPPRAARRRRWGTAPGRRRACRGRRSAARSRRIFDQIARATSSRGASSSTKRSPSASSSVAPSPRIASVTRKPSRPGTPVTAVGWNCMNSRSASAAPAAAREQQADARASPAGWSCATTARPRRRWRGSTARAWIARPSSQTTPTQRPSRIHSVGGAGALEDVDAAASRRRRAESWRTTRRPVALPPAWTTRRRECPPSRPSARLPWRSASKCTPRRSRSRDGARRLAAQDGRGARAHEVAPGALGVLAVQVGRVVGGQRRGEAALRPVARGPRQRRGGDERDARARRGRRSARRRGPAAPAPTTATSASMRAAAGHARVPYPRWPRRSCFATRRRCEHDTGPHPERPARIVAIERALGRARLAGLGRARVAAPPSARSSAGRASRATTCDAIERAVRGGRRRARRRHGRRREGSYARRAARGGRRGRRSSTRCWAATARASAPRCTARPGHHARPARAMGFCLFNNVAVAARRALDRWGAERVLILDWDVHHGNGTNDIFHATPTCSSCRSTSRRCIPGTGPASRRGLGRGRGLHGQPAGAGRVGRRGVVLAGRARRRAARARVPPGPDPRLGRLRRARARPARRAAR